MEIQVGDLVKIRDYDWISRDIGIVTDVRELVHNQTGATYTAVTALVGTKEYTVSAGDFELVSSVERKKCEKY